MDDALSMQVRHAEAELPEDPAGFDEGESTMLDEVVEELAASAEFGDEVDGGFGSEELVESEEVRMAQSTVVMKLASEQGEGGGGVGGLWIRRATSSEVEWQAGGKGTLSEAASKEGDEEGAYASARQTLRDLLHRHSRPGQAVDTESNFAERTCGRGRVSNESSMARHGRRGRRRTFSNDPPE